MEDTYHTIRRPATHELKIKGSRFIGQCRQVDSVEQAHGFLEKVRKREHAATHNCFAYTVGLFDESKFKYSDDGEPSGTAGRPIYDVLTGRTLSNTIVIVTRYFGGTKLGTGGLVRAYSEAATGTLDAAGKRENYVTTTLAVTTDFSQYDLLLKTIHKYEARQVDADFTDHVRVRIKVRLSRVDSLRDEIVQISAGRAKIEQTP